MSPSCMSVVSWFSLQELVSTVPARQGSRLLVYAARLLVEFDRSDNLDACLLETLRKTASASDQVDPSQSAIRRKVALASDLPRSLVLAAPTSVRLVLNRMCSTESYALKSSSSATRRVRLEGRGIGSWTCSVTRKWPPMRRYC